MRMCRDMYRVMPWAYPPVVGGTQNEPKEKPPYDPESVITLSGTTLTMGSGTGYEAGDVWALDAIISVNIKGLIVNNLDALVGASVVTDIKVSSSVTNVTRFSFSDGSTQNVSIVTAPSNYSIMYSINKTTGAITGSGNGNSTSYTLPKKCTGSMNVSNPNPSFTWSYIKIYSADGTLIQELNP